MLEAGSPCSQSRMHRAGILELIPFDPVMDRVMDLAFSDLLSEYRYEIPSMPIATLIYCSELLCMNYINQSVLFYMFSRLVRVTSSCSKV